MYEVLKNKIRELEGGSTTVADSASEDDDIPLKMLIQETTAETPNTSRDMFWQTYEHFAGEGTSGNSQRKREHQSVNTLDKEINAYTNLPVIARFDNPVQWWNDNKLRFAKLFPLAAIYLSAPAGSVASEQVFSEAGNIYDARRSRLTPDRAEALLFVHHNLPKLNFKY
ncbi:unnamed protein product [Acanthoscelides obtectus]|uniref:HAT C-terminal dimerisation domain-containing protein n=1 Tax=Acanthoscelides obtectus TaxID=200917 RepID=A0A9P0KAL2_ACAOB|nr:unnamed protein product [Acanthoscelides obtectus]CAK1654268.1 Zinc finger BED domain-containing protein 1 [Acanthoscelides obtectus]